MTSQTFTVLYLINSESGYFQELKKDFIDICVNTISYMIFERNNDPALVRLLLRKTKPYMKDKSSLLNFAYRPFKERFGTPRWTAFSPLHWAVLSKKAETFTYGVLEEEKNPLDLLMMLLTNQVLDRARQDGSVILATNEVKISLRLCARVLLQGCGTV
ncbi:ankyrin repeat and SOCS box protein 17-like [Pseudophryne corroboree]|uniref:ankyrin repeat and SOCS box protein 17-like n=1 Tax=Pseudophryne corroboree TaxID=495146 RepID=UPI003081D0B6